MLQSLVPDRGKCVSGSLHCPLVPLPHGDGGGTRAELCAARASIHHCPRVARQPVNAYCNTGVAEFSA